MALNVWQSPGCADLIASDLDEIVEAGGVVIDAGRIAQSLGWSPTDPDRNMALLRVAVAMRTTAIKVAIGSGCRRRGADGLTTKRRSAGRPDRRNTPNDRDHTRRVLSAELDACSQWRPGAAGAL